MAATTKRALMTGAALSLMIVGAPPAMAQQAAATQDGSVQEIIVTARKRQESILNVPVVETALPQQQLQRFQTQDLKGIAALVPGLAFGDSVLATGTQVSLRGVGTSALDPGVDASVSLNIDGLQLSQGLAYSSAFFDMSQVEVLKGPQALFYGKSSPGGVISIRTADPTDKFEVIARAAYEFEAHERQGQIIISGPVTDTLKLRLASQFDSQDGFYDNVATALPGFGGLGPASNRVSPEKSYFIRGTALWNPTSEFDARLKVNQVHDRTLYGGTAQNALCPDGTGPVPGIGIPFISPNDNCKLDRQVAIVDLDPAAFPGVRNGGVPYVESTQTYGTLELNYRPRRDLVATSVTGYYDLHSTSLLNPEASYAGPILAATNGFHRREVTEELRLNSDFVAPVNFTLGGFLERGQFSDSVTLAGNQDLGMPLLLQKGDQTVDITTNSLFGQVRYKIIPELEIAAGARWTDETRKDTAVDLATGAPVPVALAVPRIHSSNVSPELTLTYKPAEDVTFFGSLKQGYKSGSFDVSTPATPGENNSFGDEKVQGGEIGMKSRWLDRRLAFNLAAYDYRYTGLQVGAVEQAQGGITAYRTVNAGSALVYGVESDVAYRPPQVEGLGLHASVNWNHARFKELDNVQCYGGQTIAEGCNEDFSATANEGLGGFTAQNQSGLPLIRAPLWEANFGFDYETDIGHDLKLVLSSTTQYSSKYLTDIAFAYYQPAFFKTDVSLTLQGPKDRWEVALIGKNLNNALTTGNCGNSNIQGGLIGGYLTGTNLRGPAGTDEINCWMDRGREVWMRLTLKPFN
jgi:iron complex outermembrane receptor protein